MKQSFTKENIHKLLSNLQGFESIEILQEGVAYRLTLSAGEKTILFQWRYELGEVFVEYLENEVAIFSDWFECLSSDELNDFVSYIELVARRYLYSSTRIFKNGFIFKTSVLQYQTNNGWLNVLHP